MDQPMAATLTQERFTDRMDLRTKFDGIRLLAYKNAQTFGSTHAIDCNIPAVTRNRTRN